MLRHLTTGVIMSSMLGLWGCVPPAPVPPEIIEVPMYMACKEQPPPPPVVIKEPVPMPCQLKEDTADAPKLTKVKYTGNGVAKANAQARRGPTDSKFVNSVQVYSYMPGALYQAYLGVTNATLILLQPGETLGPYVSGDKERWDVDDIQTGSPEGPRQAVVAKCKWPDTTTNLSIATNKRLYLLELRCGEGAYHAAISWEYPGEGGLHVTRPAVAPVAAPVTEPPVEAIAPEHRNYRYSWKIKKGTPPAWYPMTVYDNGQQTIIEFPKAISTGDAPVLYLRTAEDTQSVVNYRVIAHGTMYQIDRLFEHAELVQGEKRPTIVTITRDADGQ